MTNRNVSSATDPRWQVSAGGTCSQKVDDAGLWRVLAGVRDANWERHTATGAPKWLELDWFSLPDG